ncbi:MAG: RNA 2'-phosphotransferase [Flavobacteriales bacterium]|jgi:putative RNA 2'-phosphotransferase|nr:RNA 2'-phosphotransferase [Flavobacteriales bacterium]
MTEQEKKKISKFLSLVLRHKPEKIGLSLDHKGWAKVQELIDKSSFKIDIEALKEIVDTNNKQRFSFNDDFSLIRANQGHSIPVDLDLEELSPPAYLYHGTVEKYIGLIQRDGLKKMKRNHVHLSQDRETAEIVGARRGKPIILSIRSGEMSKNGFRFFKSKNGVWLTSEVPEKYISFKK